MSHVQMCFSAVCWIVTKDKCETINVKKLSKPPYDKLNYKMILKQTFDTVEPKQLFTKLYAMEKGQKLHFK